jgi:hypothetical protein
MGYIVRPKKPKKKKEGRKKQKTLMEIQND